MDCALCSSSNGVCKFELEFAPNNESVEICDTCKSQIDSKEFDTTHWHCLSDSMWSEDLATQALAYRVLRDMGDQDRLEQMYFEDSDLKWINADKAIDEVICKDSNGARLFAGDSVTLIKDLVVKGGGFTAKRGTLVKGIALTDNPEHIEGRVNGQRIVLVSNFLKKVAD
ncbi:MAG: PhnA domain protein [Halobacteriovorax sp.]|nr:PhnA domain protein [Halobacteriovorax sp.]